MSFSIIDRKRQFFAAYTDLTSYLRVMNLKGEIIGSCYISLVSQHLAISSKESVNVSHKIKNIDLPVFYSTGIICNRRWLECEEIASTN